MVLPFLLKDLSPGRVIIVRTNQYGYSLAIVLQEPSKYSKNVSCKCLMLCNHEDAEAMTSKALITTNYCVQPYKPMNTFYKPVTDIQHVILDIPGEMIVGALRKTESVNAKRILSDYNQRQLPRFK